MDRGTPVGNGAKYLSALDNINVAQFEGTEGFTRLVNFAYFWFLLLQACYDTQVRLITQIDTAVRNSPTLQGKVPAAHTKVTAEPQITASGHRPAVDQYLRSPKPQNMALTPHVQQPNLPPFPPIIDQPTVAFVQEALNSRLAHWDATALSEPTGDATVDTLIAQLMGSYADQSTANFSGSFLLSIIEDLVTASQSAGRTSPGDLTRY